MTDMFDTTLWGKGANRIRLLAGVVAVILFGVTVWRIHQAWKGCDIEAMYVWAGVWTVGPPMWFWAEYFLLYRKHGNPVAFELFRHGQHLSVAVWAAVALSLVALASSDYFKNCSSHTPVASVMQPNKSAQTGLITMQADRTIRAESGRKQK